MTYLKLPTNLIIGHKEIDEANNSLLNKLNELIKHFTQKNQVECETCLTEFQSLFIQHSVHKETIMGRYQYTKQTYNDAYLKKFWDKSRLWNYKCKTLEQWKNCIHCLLNSFLSAILHHDLTFKEHLKSINIKESNIIPMVHKT